MFFEHFVNIVIRVILGWDPKKKRSYPGGGLFGYTKAFLAVNEGQARTDLHLHMIVFLFGHDHFLNRMQFPGATTNLYDYIMEIIQASLPLPSNCLHCQIPLTLNEDAFKNARYTRKRGSVSEMKILSCSGCDKSIPVSSFVNATLNVMSADGPINRKKIDAIIWSGVHSSSPLQANIESVARMVHCNGHDPLHRRTCSKSKRARDTGMCRFNAPYKPKTGSVVLNYDKCADCQTDNKTEDPSDDNDDDLTDVPAGVCANCKEKLVLESVTISNTRNLASVWYTQNNHVIQSTLGCNNNVQYIRNFNISKYDGCYITKSTKENANSLSGAMAGVHRALRREHQNLNALLQNDSGSETKETDHRTGMRRVNSAWRGNTASEIIGAPMAGLLCLAKDKSPWPYNRSHDSVHIAPKAGLSFLLGNRISQRVSITGSATCPNFFDFLFRPPTLDHLEAFEFFENYERVQCTHTGNILMYHHDHPLALTHAMYKRTTEAVTILTCQSIGNMDTLRADVDSADMSDIEKKTLEKKRLHYAQVVLLSCVPMKKLSDVLGPRAIPYDNNPRRIVGPHPLDDLWWETFCEFFDDPASPITRRGRLFIYNQQQQYENTITPTDVDDMLGTLGPDTERPEREFEEESDDDISDLENIDLLLPDRTVDDDRIDLISIVHLLKDPPKPHPMPVLSDTEIQERSELANAALEILRTSSKASMSFGVRCSNAQAQGILPDANLSMTTRQTRFPTFVDKLCNSTAGVSSIEEASRIISPEEKQTAFNGIFPDYATLKDVADHKKFTLCGKQRQAFFCVGATFIRLLSSTMPMSPRERTRVENALKKAPAARENSDGWVVIALFGEGGTGKSHVIRALGALADCWGASLSLVIVSSTGFSAAILDAVTLYKATGMSGVGYPKNPRAAYKMKWAPVVMGVLDEVSMVGCLTFVDFSFGLISFDC